MLRDVRSFFFSQKNFKIGGELMPLKIVHALGVCKHAACTVNERLGLLDPTLGGAIRSACQVGERSFPSVLQQKCGVRDTRSAPSSLCSGRSVYERCQKE